MICGLSLASAQNGGVSSGYPTPKNGFNASQQRGHGLYLRYCVGCHGVQGDGNGENAPYLDPKPRDFVAATFKCRSTPTGTLPLDSDLMHTLQRGVQASGMPSWIPLSDENRVDLVAYIKTFSPRWQSEKAGDPIKIPTEPPVTMESITTAPNCSKKWSAGSATDNKGAGWTVCVHINRQQGSAHPSVQLCRCRQRCTLQMRTSE